MHPCPLAFPGSIMLSETAICEGNIYEEADSFCCRLILIIPHLSRQLGQGKFYKMSPYL
jgi:hypothetical protein